MNITTNINECIKKASKRIKNVFKVHSTRINYVLNCLLILVLNYVPKTISKRIKCSIKLVLNSIVKNVSKKNPQNVSN